MEGEGQGEYLSKRWRLRLRRKWKERGALLLELLAGVEVWFGVRLGGSHA